MTTQLLPSEPVSPAAGLGRRRRLVRLVAIAACLPYLCLKVAWIAGSHLGIPDGSPLLEHRGTLAVANGITVLMDACVIVLAILLTRPWGRRVPAWLLAAPVWLATGLLAPIMAGYPLEMLVKGFGGSRGGESEPFLDSWVFGVVYGGFIVQGLALGALFVWYTRERWGHLWRGRIRELPVGHIGGAQRFTAVAAGLLALFPLTLRLLWACGATAGLNAGRIADRGDGSSVMEGVYAGFLTAAVLGAWLLAFRRGRNLPVAVPLALTWVGSGAAFCWGGWMALASLPGVDDPADRPTQLMNLTYAVQMLVGVLAATLVTHFLAERSASAQKRPPV